VQSIDRLSSHTPLIVQSDVDTARKGVGQGKLSSYVKYSSGKYNTNGIAFQEKYQSQRKKTSEKSEIDT